MLIAIVIYGTLLHGGPRSIRFKGHSDIDLLDPRGRSHLIEA